MVALCVFIMTALLIVVAISAAISRKISHYCEQLTGAWCASSLTQITMMCLASEYQNVTVEYGFIGLSAIIVMGILALITLFSRLKLSTPVIVGIWTGFAVTMIVMIVLSYTHPTLSLTAPLNGFMETLYNCYGVIVFISMIMTSLYMFVAVDYLFAD